jgi:ABC-type Fe3+ transport system permease subunit
MPCIVSVASALSVVKMLSCIGRSAQRTPKSIRQVLGTSTSTPFCFPAVIIGLGSSRRGKFHLHPMRNAV